MESEGPYTIDSKGEIWWILFDGEKVQTAPKDLVCYSTLVCSLLNTAYAEGRKSMEKEIEEKKAIKDTLLCGTGFVMEGKRVPPEDVYLSETEIKLQKVEKEFKELLDLANQAGNFNQDMMQWKIKFEDWKKAQGIENRIRGGQDGE